MTDSVYLALSLVTPSTVAWDREIYVRTLMKVPRLSFTFAAHLAAVAVDQKEASLVEK